MDVDQLAVALLTDKPSRRVAAAEELATLGPDASPAALALVTACGNPALVDLCIGTLEELGPPPVEQLPELAKLVASPDENVAYWAATMLGRSGEAATPFLAPLEETAKNDDALNEVRERAVWAIGKLGADAKPAEGTLRAIAESGPTPRIKRLASTALANLGG
ncbi:HEAT repeat domain-containing protein [Botrimarina mediterranea]|uniref:HEAT repeat domain-containing protein n=1 Tax=Botrimarina mediterranea TaxID=2528022 RepID=UPI0011A06065|nr:HEAT repeat domain-containing protein [Botrimarina mediterranea]